MNEKEYQLNRAVEQMKKCGMDMMRLPYSVGDVHFFVFSKMGVLASRRGTDLEHIQETDVEVVSVQNLFSPELSAIVVSKTPYCQSCLAAGKTVPAVLDDMAQIVGNSAVIVESAAELATALKESAGCFFRIGYDEKNRGIGYTVTSGRTLEEAVTAMTVLEKSAQVCEQAEVLGGARPLDEKKARDMRQFYVESYSKVREEKLPTERTLDFMTRQELILRQELAFYGRRLVDEGLVQGTWGNLSARLDDTYMLVTPSGLDYMTLTGQDMVKVKIDDLTYEGKLKPTSERGLHGAIYERRPEVMAVIHTHSTACSVFAAAEKDLPIEEQEGQLGLGTAVRTAEYGGPGSQELVEHTVKALGNSSACIMAHHGMVACGKDLKTAFENCKLVEAYGKAYIEQLLIC
ncbi:MAG: hypothetical protein HFE73_00205 [Firmicutes bacterium]|nr:hypothetical protein [Bacillota bacterium]